MIELERAQSRLENIRSVEPILGALHTISLGSWQAALNQRGRVQQYTQRLETLLPVVTAHLPTKPPLSPPRERGECPNAAKPRGTGGAKIAALVVGSERGLCGRFNIAAVERAEAYLAEQEAEVELMALGSRVRRILERRGHPLAWSSELSITALPSLALARDLARRWLAGYEARQVDAVDLIYNAYRGLGSYEPTVARLIPPAAPPLSPPLAGGMKGEELPTRGGDTGGKIPIIVETDPASLFSRAVEQLTAARVYEMLLESATAEHAARYELMGAATQNADRLIAELTQAIQTARQQAITQQMQELAAGAGMIGQRNR
jgi:F-type H+-transporting ATPase subunit gamma